MKRDFRRILFALAIVAPSLLANAAERFTSVDYLGHRIPLAREYANFDDFKDDLEKLSAQSIRLIEPIMRSAPFRQSFPNTAALSRELERIRFPGYGTFYANQLGVKLDPSLESVSVEISG